LARTDEQCPECMLWRSPSEFSTWRALSEQPRTYPLARFCNECRRKR
jgi:hypothetical protein